jgi:hypothetical protein
VPEHLGRGRRDREAGNAQALLRRGEDPHRAGRLARRTLDRRTLGLYYSWSKEFLEAGKRRLAGDTARAATSDEVKGPHAQKARACAARLTLTLTGNQTALLFEEVDTDEHGRLIPLSS